MEGTRLTESQGPRSAPAQQGGTYPCRGRAGFAGPAAQLLMVIQLASARPRWLSEQTDDELDYSLSRAKEALSKAESEKRKRTLRREG